MRNNARRIWARTPQNCATTNRACFQKHGYLQEIAFSGVSTYFEWKDFSTHREDCQPIGCGPCVVTPCRACA